jgi:hypothetical protein
MQLTFEGAPPTDALLYYSMRLEQLKACRFVAVRNMAYVYYKRPDGRGLMTYHQTLLDREKVIQTILQHELHMRYILPDYLSPALEEDGEGEFHKRLAESVASAVRMAMANYHPPEPRLTPPSSPFTKDGHLNPFFKRNVRGPPFDDSPGAPAKKRRRKR